MRFRALIRVVNRNNVGVLTSRCRNSISLRDVIEKERPDLRPLLEEVMVDHPAKYIESEGRQSDQGGRESRSSSSSLRIQPAQSSKPHIPQVAVNKAPIRKRQAAINKTPSSSKKSTKDELRKLGRADLVDIARSKGIRRLFDMDRYEIIDEILDVERTGRSKSNSPSVPKEIPALYRKTTSDTSSPAAAPTLLDYAQQRATRGSLERLAEALRKSVKNQSEYYASGEWGGKRWF